MDFNELNKQIEMAKQSERNNNRPPRARPFKDRALFLLNFAYRVAAVADLRTKGLGRQQKNTIITGKDHCCMKPLSELTPIKLNAMKVPMVHCGTFLMCRVLSEPIVIVGTEVLVEDVDGHVEGLSLYNFNSDLNNCTWLKPGTIMLIKEPYLKYSSMSVDNAMIRVDSVSDVIFVEKSDRELLARANALCWFKADRLSFDALKQQANNAFRKKDYEGAIRLYRRALNVQPSSPTIHLNLAAAFLKLEHFYEAYQEANEALRSGVDDEKALFRMGKAAYGMRNWSEAVAHFETLLDRFPNNPDTMPELQRARHRQDEAHNGKYDLYQLYLDSNKGQVYMDVADYIGPVKVADIEGKGKGLFVTRNVKKGTLLIASKAYAMRKLNKETKKDDAGLHSVNMITQEFWWSTKVHVIIDTMQMLKRNPQTSKELYALYAGDDVNREEGMTVPEGIIDAGRIERICSYNGFRPQDFGVIEIHRKEEQQQENLDFEYDDLLSGFGLWLLPSFLNHSCLGNTYRMFFGDIMFITALRDLKRGEELTISYLDPSDFYAKRQQTLGKWKFTCQCLLCKLDGTDPRGEKRREELIGKFDKMKPSVLKEPVWLDEVWLDALQKLVSQLRMSYDSAKRAEQRVHLFRPLMMLAMAHQHLGQFEKAVECLQECVASVGQPLIYRSTPIIQLKIAELFGLMSKKQMANKMEEEAYHMTKVKMGGAICRDLFASMFKRQMI